MDQVFEYMESKGIRQQWLADQLGVHKSLLSKYKSGERVPPADLVIRAARLFGLHVTVTVATDADRLAALAAEAA